MNINIITQRSKNMNKNVEDAKISAVYFKDSQEKIEIKIKGDSLTLLLMLLNVMREFDKKKVPVVAIAKMADLAESNKDYARLLRKFYNEFAESGHDSMTEMSFASLMVLALTEYVNHETDGEKE